MSANPIPDDHDILSTTKAVVDKLVDAVVTKDEDDASSQEDSGRWSIGSQFGSGAIDQEVKHNSARGYSIGLVTKDEDDDASSQEESRRCSGGSLFDPCNRGLTSQEVEDHSVCGYSLMQPLVDDLESSLSTESLDDFLSSPIPMSQGSTDSFYCTDEDDDYPSSPEEPQFSDDFLPRDTSPETVGRIDSDDEDSEEVGDEVRQGLVAEIEFIERMMLFFMDAGIVHQDHEQMGGGDHGQEPEDELD